MEVVLANIPADLERATTSPSVAVLKPKNSPPGCVAPGNGVKLALQVPEYW